MAAATVTLHSLEATDSLARGLAPLLELGDVVELTGPIGAGKTTFTAALARVLGAAEPVRSPTYTVAHWYELPGGRSLVHLDCYRDEAQLGPEAWGDLEAHFELPGIACIEWPDPVRPWIAERRCWRIAFETVGDNARLATVRAPEGVRVLDVLAPGGRSSGAFGPTETASQQQSPDDIGADTARIERDGSATPTGSERMLCIDTSGRALVVAVADAQGTLLAGRRSDERAQTLLAHVDAVLLGAGCARGEITHVAVGTGPGGFTGLRVGVAAARGIAATLGVPLAEVASLGAQALSDERPVVDVVWSVLDARRGEHYVQQWQVRPQLRALDAPRTIPSSEVADLVGEVVDLGRPSPAGLARAAAAAVRAVPADARVHDVLPQYVRAPDAEPPRPRLRIDELRADDLDALLEIEGRSFPTPWTPAMYQGELDRPDRDAVRLAARDLRGGARLVGAALAARIGDAWHIMNVLVDPPARRRGIAARLLDELLERTCALGSGEGWTLEVRVSNDAAISLYESREFVNLGRRPGYYSDTGEDALIMWRSAVDAAPRDEMDVEQHA